MNDILTLLFLFVHCLKSLQKASPNIVFILTDDQDRALESNVSSYTKYGSLKAMPQTLLKLKQKGAYGQNFFVNTPICCPSRTEFFTGRYYHNIGAPYGNCMNINAEANIFNASRSIFSLLQAGGYQTGVFGKVTNDQPNYFPSGKSDGMDVVGAPIDYNNFYGAAYFEKYPNGSTAFPKYEGMDAYQTSKIGNQTMDWLRYIKNSNPSQPFFLYWGPHAPHYPATPAPWYAHAFDDADAPFTHNYNTGHQNKHSMVANNPALDDNAKSFIDQHYRDRWASLLSVDDFISEMIDFLEDSGMLDNTYIIYTSDHGYHLGQWRIGCSKEQPYETDVRIPFLIRGPGIEADSEFDLVAGNVDVLPTILDLAGIPVPPDADGKSFAAHIMKSNKTSNQDWRTSFLLEYKSVGTYFNDHCDIWFPNKTDFQGKYEAGPPKINGATSFCDDTTSNSWRALRIINQTFNMLYVEFDSEWKFDNIQFHELYDINEDPFQMDNIYDTASEYLRDRLHAELEEKYGCQGRQCI